MGPISSVVRKNCGPAFGRREDSVFMNICCNKKFVEFSIPQQRRTTGVFESDV